MNIFVENPSKNVLNSIHLYAWKNGLKTGMYYLRSKAAVDPIKFTLSSKYQNKFKDDTEAMVCNLDGECTSCSA